MQKRRLIRHKDREVFDKIGFGMVTKHLDETKCKVYWLKSKYQTIQLKKYMILLDEQTEDGYVEWTHLEVLDDKL
jgi:hypothetical protein